MLFELSYRDNSGKLSQTNKQTHTSYRDANGMFSLLFFGRIYALKEKKQKDSERTTFWALSILV